jgi:ribosomal protein S12 methylthiotransferase
MSLPKKVYIVSLGCPKNLVDTERYTAILAEKGYELCSDQQEADLVLVNTCSFIHDARAESIAVLEEVTENKDGQQKLVVTGCLVDRYLPELKSEYPQVDLWNNLETFNRFPLELERIVPLSNSTVKATRTESPDTIPWAGFQRHRLTPPHTTYLKISEGCNHSCSFCSIPSFKGKQRSVPLELLLTEAKTLVAQGAREITLIGQDTIAYGSDFASSQSKAPRSSFLRELLTELNCLDGLEWIRILYTYPTRLADELEWAYSSLGKCIPYLDLPLQHLSDQVLESMRRGTPWESIREHLKRLRQAVPNLVVRSTCIVGFPGETEKDFRFLQQRFEDLEVDHLGVFAYSDEEGTPAHQLKRKVRKSVIERRHQEMLQWAGEYCQKRAEKQLGAHHRIMVDTRCAPPAHLFSQSNSTSNQNWWCGRWYGQAPEIDGVVYFQYPHLESSNGISLNPGDFLTVCIKEALYPEYLATPLS